VQAILSRHDTGHTRVFVVWEPILSTDWAAPTSFAMNRIADRRVQQYWDSGHVLAKAMANDARSPQPTEDCCTRTGILWDLAAVYPGGASWADRMPTATIFNGPVVDIASELEAALAGAKRP
jgi:hypothetical protein